MQEMFLGPEGRVTIGQSALARKPDIAGIQIVLGFSTGTLENAEAIQIVAIIKHVIDVVLHLVYPMNMVPAQCLTELATESRMFPFHGRERRASIGQQAQA